MLLNLYLHIRYKANVLVESIKGSCRSHRFAKNSLNINFLS